MRILFLCLGNICRSPAAEEIFRQAAVRAGLAIEADSAGTGGWHSQEPPYAPMQRAARARGYDLSALRARQLCADDFQRFDLILAMDGHNLADARRMAPDAWRRANLPRLHMPRVPPDAWPSEPSHQIGPEESAERGAVAASAPSTGQTTGADAQRQSRSWARLEPFLSPRLEGQPSGHSAVADVPDPYYTRDFTGCLDIIEAGVAVWIKRLQRAQ